MVEEHVRAAEVVRIADVRIGLVPIAFGDFAFFSQASNTHEALG
jgi:hypothetical protein